jgi:quercetin dioxygenase-like cupin family protein
VRLAFALLSLAVVACLPQPASAQQAQAWSPQTIVWQESYPDGTKFALLQGRRDVAGEAFTYAFFIPSGYWEHHAHSADARVALVQGALRLAYGPALDSTAAARYPVGSYVLVPANTAHTMGADEATIIIGTAVGPWVTHHHTDAAAERPHHSQHPQEKAAAPR